HVEHVAQALGAFAVAVARQQRRVDAKARREAREERILGQDAAGVVEEEQVLALAGFEHADAGAAAGDVDEAAVHHATAAGFFTAPSSRGWIQKRSSVA